MYDPNFSPAYGYFFGFTIRETQLSAQAQYTQNENPVGISSIMIHQSLPADTLNHRYICTSPRLTINRSDLHHAPLHQPHRARPQRSAMFVGKDRTPIFFCCPSRVLKSVPSVGTASLRWETSSSLVVFSRLENSCSNLVFTSCSNLDSEMANCCALFSAIPLKRAFLLSSESREFLIPETLFRVRACVDVVSHGRDQIGHSGHFPSDDAFA